GRTPYHVACVPLGGSRISTPRFELDRSPAAFIAKLEADSPMMQAPERRWLWSCLRRRRAHWRFITHRDSDTHIVYCGWKISTGGTKPLLYGAQSAAASSSIQSNLRSGKRFWSICKMAVLIASAAMS